MPLEPRGVPTGQLHGLGKDTEGSHRGGRTQPCRVGRADLPLDISEIFYFFIYFFKGSNVFILYYGGSGAPLSLGEKNTQSFPVSLGFLTRVGETQVQDKAEVSFTLSSAVPRALVSPGGSQAEAGK